MHDVFISDDQHINPTRTNESAFITSAESDAKYVKTGQGYWGKFPVDAVVDRRLSSTDVRLLLLIITLSGDKEYCWHSQQTLAKELGVSRSTVIERLGSLEQAGYIRSVSAGDIRKSGRDIDHNSNTTLLNYGLRGRGM